MNKWFKPLSLILSASLLLSGCITALDEEISTQEPVSLNQVPVQTTNNQISSDYYRAVIRDGRYQLSEAASASYTLSSSGNMEAFESGLIRVSQDIFPTDQYYLQEGQLIDLSTMTAWVGRESADNPEGLNPALPEETAAVESIEESSSIDPADTPENVTEESIVGEEQVIVDAQSTPIYLTQIMEKNIMVETEDGFNMAGIVIGLAMNSVYQYTDADGNVYEQEISMGEMRERGKAYANIIVGRLRNTAELRNIPIVVGIFRQTPNNEIAGGTFVADGISREGNYVTDWTDRNEYRVSLPQLGGGTNDQYLYFDTFSEDIVGFFPHLNGITGEALYIDGGLATLNITIMTQFYLQTEITALTQHVTDVAQNRLPEGIPIEIKIESVAGTEAVISRSGASSDFNGYVFRQ
ncbi:CamS family sex pheromone protein [Fundicoccus culcitae]|uniref:CamS family sex pheromone protein n=1 Tax=Fundicoccus culcitae TaxID=2969821 RepID=A0ABY5P5J9_9LACT|nr:CamS family sex pheromone protein [Fundicoccus culcitae]UUX33824.1 CamS family sex pheromone protein [Fundicoccus culcitae]